MTLVRRVVHILGVLLILFAVFLLVIGVSGMRANDVQGGAHEIGAIVALLALVPAALGIALLRLGRGPES